MIFLGLEKINDNKGKVGLVHYFPEQLTENELKTGILVEDLPESEKIDGKYSVAYYNYDTKSVFYEYEDIPLTENQILQKRITEQESALIELASMIGGAN